MKHQSVFSFSLILFLFYSTRTIAQSPAAAPVQAPPVAPVQAPPAPPVQAPPVPPSQAPSTQVAASPGPTDVVKILEKAGHFTILVRLLKATKEDSELLSELNNTNNGVTMFAPNDNAFSSLKVGTLNSLSDEQKAELTKFHVVPTYISSTQFQTVTNPVRTQAGTGDRVALNVTTVGSFVNLTTGLTNASVLGTVYSDNQLAIYQVDKVLLPLDVFTPKPPAPAPAPAQEKPGKKSPDVETSTPTSSKDISGAVSIVGYKNVVFLAIVMMAALFH
ncbi:fasciclin-like arabinogalactan protein 12 [Ricinus communis]|uniref:FAS1 domain-containing protein n=1 Tax=Ricinus communis TaxID=3988 RepID=B9T2Z1_RICCO|nr:fasciclin-like arabinogalactan protein 12 [Ricinus communis]EEF29776.1 conserved hypothetical protein [Ricinus communis]|eukprot:XP_002532610.1 fasciclin-like arabinogalactan protein 12 [Ricinus communis]